MYMKRILLLIVVSLMICHIVENEANIVFVGESCASDTSVTMVPNPKDPIAVGLAETQALFQQQLILTYLDPLLSDLISKTSDFKFSNVTSGNKFYGLFQCRDELSLDICTQCVGNATEKIREVCPGYDEAIVWYEECMLRYSNRSIFSISDTHPSTNLSSAVNVSRYDLFSPVLAKAMDYLIDQVSSGSSPLYHAASVTNVTLSQNLYSYVQCTPDIDDLSCNHCLRTAFEEINLCCNASVWAMVFLPSCQLRYDDRPFLAGNVPFVPNLLTDKALPPSEKKSSGENPSSKLDITRSSRPMIIVIASVVSAVIILLAAAGIWVCRKTLRKTTQQMPLEAPEGSHINNLDAVRSLEALQFDFKKIKTATSNFAEVNKLGQGGFGKVYKGKLPNGEDIAVKRLSRDSTQGTIEFQNEALLVAKLQHKNLVRLLGFCVSGKEHILIYEFLANSSLDRFLYDSLKRASLDWEVRYEIIKGIARGLLYLHEDSRLKIIHRDLKTSNILLDEAMNAKIADFGLAKLFAIDQTQGDTGKIAGTYGYMAPEYALAGHFSVKSDVYSFGVIVLEVISGQRNTFYRRHPNEEGLLSRAWRLWTEGTAMDLVDHLLGENFSVEEVKLCILIGLLCIQEDATQRPRMASVIAALNGQSIALPSPNAPHFFSIRNVEADSTCSNYDSHPENEFKQKKFDQSSGSHTEMSNITELCPR